MRRCGKHPRLRGELNEVAPPNIDGAKKLLAEAGREGEAHATPFGPFAQRFQNGDSSAYLLGWGVATYDAQYTLQSLIRTRTKGPDGYYNFSGVSNPRVDELVDAMGVEMDKVKRDAMIREALSITHNSNDAPKMYYANIR